MQEKHYIIYKILEINDQVIAAKDLETFNWIYGKAFEWANEMGRNGKRVYDLHLETPESKHQDPLNIRCFLLCKIECTHEERKMWEEME